MEVLKINRAELSAFKADHLKMVYDQKALLPFLSNEFTKENIKLQIEAKSKNYSRSNRSVLVEALRNQYDNIDIGALTKKNLDNLEREETFTITTGHQLSLFTGPLFYVIKILHVLKLCEELNTAYPKNNFVPIFWMATEDHDFEEIQTVNLFNEKLKWDSTQKGPVGRFSLDQFDSFKDELKRFFSNNPESDVIKLIDEYRGDNLADATRRLVNEIFRDYGLVIIDGDDVELKKLFQCQVKSELFDQFSHSEVVKTNKSLRNEINKIQVYPREINLFYIENGIRSRIVKEEDTYTIDGIGSFSNEEIREKLDQHPECFSPNVILRPLYQEVILPNLTYIGGGGEIAYWLQLKGVFEKVNCTFPLVSIRNSVTWIDSKTASKMSKLGIQLTEISRSVDEIKRSYVERNEDSELGSADLTEASARLGKIMEDSILATNPEMTGFAAAEVVKLNKQIEGIKTKLIKFSKSKNESAMLSIDQLFGKIFPDGKLQERSINFFSLCADGDFRTKLNILYDSLDPFEKDLIVIKE